MRLFQKQFLIITPFVVLLALATAVSADTFCELMRAGKFSEAKKQYPDQAEQMSRLGYFADLSEPNVAKGIGKLGQRINGHGAELCENVIYNRLAAYTFLDGKLGSKYQEQSTLAAISWKMNDHTNLDAYTKRLLMASGQPRPDSATPVARQYDQLAKEVGGDDSLWLMLDKAGYLASTKKEKDAAKILKAISHRDKGEQVPVSLYMQIQNAIQAKKSDEALRVLGIMQEEYPDAVGLDALTTSLADLSDDEPAANEAEAEQLTKTIYSVQLGVFASKLNANALIAQLEPYKQKIDILPKTVSGKQYFVVYAGRFTRYDDAAAFKQKLETARKETYQVIAR